MLAELHGLPRGRVLPPSRGPPAGDPAARPAGLRRGAGVPVWAAGSAANLERDAAALRWEAEEGRYLALFRYSDHIPISLQRLGAAFRVHAIGGRPLYLAPRHGVAQV